MEIFFANKKLGKILNDSKSRAKKYGKICSDLIGQRLDELDAADNLEVLAKLYPRARVHMLSMDRHGQFSVDLEQPKRLFFVPANDPIPTLESGGVDWARVTKIIILEIADPHGR